MAIHYNGNAKILFYIGGKKLIKKGISVILLMPFQPFIMKYYFSVLAFFTFWLVNAKSITSLISFT